MSLSIAVTKEQINALYAHFESIAKGVAKTKEPLITRRGFQTALGNDGRTPSLFTERIFQLMDTDRKRKRHFLGLPLPFRFVSFSVHLSLPHKLSNHGMLAGDGYLQFTEFVNGEHAALQLHLAVFFANRNRIRCSSSKSFPCNHCCAGLALFSDSSAPEARTKFAFRIYDLDNDGQISPS